MPAKIEHAEPFDKYLLDNYQTMALTKMCKNLEIGPKVGYRILKKLGIVRSPELASKFKGVTRKDDEERDKVLKENYMLKPLKHICKDLNISVKLGERALQRMGLERPKDLKIGFKAKHRGVNDPAPTPKKYYTPKGRKKKEPKPLKFDKIKEPEKVLPMRSVDYSQKVLIKIDNKTWVYRDKTA